MKESIKVELDQKQKTRENFNSRTRKLFGIVKGIHAKATNPAPAIGFLLYGTTRMLEECKIRADQNKAGAITFLRKQLTIR